MAASGTLITALAWETSDTESPTRAKYQANWNAMDLHVHDNRGGGGGVWALQTAHAPVQSGDIQIAGDLLKWWGQSASAVKTAVDADSAQTLTNKTLGASCTVATTVGVTSGGTGLTTGTTAYGIVCAGTTPTGNFQVLGSLGTSGQLLQSNGAGALPSWTTSTLAGDITGAFGSNAIAAGAVTGAKIATATITGDKLSPSYVNTVLSGSGAGGGWIVVGTASLKANALYLVNFNVSTHATAGTGAVTIGAVAGAGVPPGGAANGAQCAGIGDVATNVGWGWFTYVIATGAQTTITAQVNQTNALTSVTGLMTCVQIG